jgi:short-subunit dehydrogenase
MRIAGSIALITGASEGIGAACAAEFRKRGARLALVARNAEKLRASAGPNDLVIPGDLTDPFLRRRAIAETEAHYGRLDILVNNAGVGIYTPAWQVPLDEVRRMFELNYFALLEMTQLAVPGMKQRGTGAIVNVSSIGGRVPLAWFSTYSSSKFAVSALSTGLRMELKQHGIHVMDVCPGYVTTRFQHNVLGGKPPDRLWRARRFSITAEQCATALANGLEREKKTVVTPWLGNLLLAGASFCPAVVEYFMERMYRSLDMELQDQASRDQKQ